MTVPLRIQRRRTKGYRLPSGAIYVGRPTKWGNPYRRGVPDINGPRTAERCVELYRFFDAVRFGTLNERTQVYTLDRAKVFAELRGHDLACWCSLCDEHKDGKPLGIVCPNCKPCHADLLLEWANQ